MLSMESKRTMFERRRHDEGKRAKPTPKTAPPSESPTQRGRSTLSEKSLRGRSPSGKFAREPCRDYLKGICTKSLCDNWHLPNVNSISLNRAVDSVISARLCTGRLKVNPAQKNEKGAKSAAAFLKDARQLGCVFQDTEPPESLPILRKSTKVLGSIRRVRFIKATQRHASIRENQGPSLGKTQVKNSHQCSPYAVKFEDRFQEETERQERCARGDAWRLAKNMLKLKEMDKVTFFSPTDEWGLPAPSVVKPEEREFVVDSGASMLMLSRKDLNSAELDTVRVSKSPTTVVAARGEVHTKKKRPCMSKNWISLCQ